MLFESLHLWPCELTSALQGRAVPADQVQFCVLWQNARNERIKFDIKAAAAMAKP